QPVLDRLRHDPGRGHARALDPDPERPEPDRRRRLRSGPDREPGDRGRVPDEPRLQGARELVARTDASGIDPPGRKAGSGGASPPAPSPYSNPRSFPPW